MIIKSFEIKKLNINKNIIYFFYGKNEGLKNQIKKIYFKKIKYFKL